MTKKQAKTPEDEVEPLADPDPESPPVEEPPDEDKPDDKTAPTTVVWRSV